MIRFIAILLFSFLFLFGCTPGGEQEGENNNSNPSTWKKSTASLSIIPQNESTAYMTRMDKFCWEEDHEEPCNLTPSNPRELAEDMKPILLPKQEEIGLHHDYLTSDLPEPDQFTVTQYRPGDEEDTEIEVIKEGRDYPKFLAPKEAGKYYYLVHIQWTEERIGEAYYAFSFTVRSDS